MTLCECRKHRSLSVLCRHGSVKLSFLKKNIVSFTQLFVIFNSHVKKKKEEDNLSFYLISVYLAKICIKIQRVTSKNNGVVERQETLSDCAG